MRAAENVLVGVGCLLLAACGSAFSPHSANLEPSASGARGFGGGAASESRGSAAPASGTRLEPPTQSPLPPDVVCRLPYADFSEATGGFIDYPTGQRHADAAATVALPGNTPGQIGVNPGLTYIASVGKWFPVPYEWVAPGGSFYAYADSSGIIRAVTTSDNSVRVLTNDGGWSILGTSDTEIFLGRNDRPGVWVIVTWATPVPILDRGVWQKFAHGSVWGVDGSGNLVSHKFDGAGTDTTWGQVPGSAWVAGFDANGDPVVDIGGALKIFHADKSTTTVWPGTNSLSAGGRVFTDSHGLWFGVGGGLIDAPGHGIYLWTPSHGAQVVGPELHPAGGCGP